MDWQKIWFIIFILNISLLSNEDIQVKEKNIDSLQVDEIIEFFDTTTYEADTLAEWVSLDSIQISDCGGENYQIDERLKLYGFKSAELVYETRYNNSAKDSFYYKIDCYGGKQTFQFEKDKKHWKKLIDLSQDNVFLFNNKDSIGFLEANKWKCLTDSINSLPELKKNDFFSQVKLAAGLLSNEWGIHFAGIGHVAGKSCIKVHLEQLNKTIWFWKKLILKTETIFPNDDIEIVEAVSFKVDIPIPDSSFHLPYKKWQKTSTIH